MTASPAGNFLDTIPRRPQSLSLVLPPRASSIKTRSPGPHPERHRGFCRRMGHSNRATCHSFRPSLCHPPARRWIGRPDGAGPTRVPRRPWRTQPTGCIRPATLNTEGPWDDPGPRSRLSRRRTGNRVRSAGVRASRQERKSRTARRIARRERMDRLQRCISAEGGEGREKRCGDGGGGQYWRAAVMVLERFASGSRAGPTAPVSDGPQRIRRLRTEALTALGSMRI